MSMVTASLAVRPENRIISETIAEAAEILKQEGFEVIYPGRLSVMVKADESVFLEQFSVQLKPDTSFYGHVKARNARLSSLVEAIEVATPALSFL